MGNDYSWSTFHHAHEHMPSNTEPLQAQAAVEIDTDMCSQTKKSASQLFYSMFTPIKLGALLTSNLITLASLSIP